MFEQQDELQERRLQHQLEMQSMQIERVFNRHQVDAHVAGGTVKPRSISFNLQAQLATGLERLKVLTDDLMHTLGVPVSLSREDGQLRLDVTQPSTPPVALLDLMSLLTDLPPVTAVLGLAEDGRPVLLDFSEEDMTHILVSGLSGAGKTTLLQSLVMSLALTNRQSRVQFVVLDGKSDVLAADVNLHTLNYLPHMLAGVMSHQNDIQDTLAFLTDEIRYRQDYEVVAPTIVVVIDAVDALLARGDSLIQNAILSLVQRGAEVGVHMVMSTQQPQTAVLDNLFKANISIQIVGRLADSEQACTVTGLQRSQAEYLLGQGDFLAITGQYMTHFQAAFIGDYDLHLTLQELHRKRAPTLLAQSVEDWQPISLSNLDIDDMVDELPKHFLYKGDAIALAYEEFSPAAAVIEAEELLVEETDDFAEESFYVPRPVVRVFHDAAADDVSEVEIEDDEVWDVADSPTEEDEDLPDAVAIYEALARPRPQPKYTVYRKTDVQRPSLPEILPEERLQAGEIDEEPSDFGGRVEDEVKAPVEADKPDEESEEDVESEYVQFEDDWLPFDDDE